MVNFERIITLMKITGSFLDYLKNLFLLLFFDVEKYNIQVCFIAFLGLPILLHVLMMVTGADPLAFLRIIMNVIQAYIYILLCGYSEQAIKLYACICVFNVILVLIDITYRAYTDRVFQYLISACNIYSRTLWPVFIYDALLLGFIFASEDSPFATIEYRILLCTYFWVGDYMTRVATELIAAAEPNEMEPEKTEIDVDWLKSSDGALFAQPLFPMALYIFCFVIVTLVFSAQWFSVKVGVPIGDRILCIYFMLVGGVFAICTGCPLAYYIIVELFNRLAGGIKYVCSGLHWACTGCKKAKATKTSKTAGASTESPMAAQV